MTKIESLDREDLLASIDAKILEASRPGDRARPLQEFTPREIELIKGIFIDHGLKIEGLGEEDRKSLLKEEQFRGKPGSYDSLVKDRGVGMVGVMGRQKVEDLINFYHKVAVHMGWEEHKIGGHDGTQGRGLQQMTADLISIAVFGPEKQWYFLHGMNQRIRKGLREVYKDEPSILKVINLNFSDVPEPQIPSKLASVPPGALHHIWNYLMTIEPR